MSYIATFYLLTNPDVESIASAAEMAPKPRKILGIIPRKVVDMKEAFWEAIQGKATEARQISAFWLCFRRSVHYVP